MYYRVDLPAKRYLRLTGVHEVVMRDVLLKVLDALEALNIPYMIVGSFASTFWGRPRTTHDADLVIEIAPDEASGLASLLSDEFYAPDFVIKEAVERRDHFNVIHMEHPFKVDLCMGAEGYAL